MMKRLFATPLTIAATALMSAGNPAGAQELAETDWRAAAAKHGWHTDYEAAEDEARRSGKPMMIVFRCVP